MAGKKTCTYCLKICVEWDVLAVIIDRFICCRNISIKNVHALAGREGYMIQICMQDSRTNMKDMLQTAMHCLGDSTYAAYHECMYVQDSSYVF